MLKLAAMVLLVSTPIVLRGQGTQIQHFTFKGHTTAGTVSGTCVTEQVNTVGYHYKWTLTLQFDAETERVARQLTPDQFADMVRTQSTDIGSVIIVLGLWGDLTLLPTSRENAYEIEMGAPEYETRPNLITVTQVKEAPFTLQLLFEEPDSYLDLVARQPSQAWWTLYLQSYYRLGTNRPNGFSDAEPTGGDQVAKRTRDVRAPGLAETRITPAGQ